MRIWIAFGVFLLGQVLAPTLINAFTTPHTGEVEDTDSLGFPSSSIAQLTFTDVFMDGIGDEVCWNILSTLQCRVGDCESNPATSCQDVMDRGAAVTGTYWVSKCDGSTTQVYCTMDNPCGCSGTGAWTRIGQLSMSDPTQLCLSGMGVINDPRFCSHNTQSGPCASLSFNSNFQQYNRVCGRSIGFSMVEMHQRNLPDNNQAYTIDDPYYDGLSVTYGCSPHNNIWTLAAIGADDSPYACPCSTTVPPLIGDWFCEAGTGTSWQAEVVYKDDPWPVWDGVDCDPATTHCDPSVTGRWFCKDLASSTRENIVVRACGEERQSNDERIQLVELYIQ